MHARTDTSSEPEGYGEVAIDPAIPVPCRFVRKEETRRVKLLRTFEQGWVPDKHAVKSRHQLARRWLEKAMYSMLANTVVPLGIS